MEEKKYELKVGYGTLRRVFKKEQESHADMKGDAKVACPHCAAEFEVWLNGWGKTSQKGNKYCSLSIKPKVPRTIPQSAPIETKGSEPTMQLSDLPF